MGVRFGFAAGVLLLAGSVPAALVPGEGVANEPADGTHATNVAFVQRGGGNEYGFGIGRQYVTPLGLTVLSWSLPNEMCLVRGVRANLGVGRYVETYGLDVGFWSTSGAFRGLAGNVIGNFVDRDGTGLQVGLVNLVEGEFTGVQIGILNSTQHLRGMQVGLMNFNPRGIFFPILNFGL